MTAPIRIAVDAMGGDHGPAVVVEGALAAAAQSPRVELILVGKQDKVRRLVRDLGMPERRPRVVNADQVVGMAENPKASLRKRTSSLSVAADLVKKGEADALISMGNTGAVLATTVIKWRMLPGISRPALAAVMPIPGHHVLLLDVGANVDCRPRHLIDFALMGSIYAEQIFGREKPRVGVLSIGEEDSKGNELTIAVFKELKGSKLNFVGNAEGRDILSARFDVIVCDGFVGNCLLKFGESVVEMIFRSIKGKIGESLVASLAGLAIKPQLKEFKEQVTADQYGGAPLLGVNGVCIVGHGSGGPVAVKNAVLLAAMAAERRVNERIVRMAEEFYAQPATAA